MSNTIVSSSVSANASVTTYNINTEHKKNETSSEAIDIGNLNGESSIISVSDQGQAAGEAVSTTFTSTNGVTSLSESFSNIIVKALADFKLIDSSGTVVADNQGTTDQKAAYTQWTEGTLALADGTYTATATPGALAGNQSSLSISSMEQQGTTLQVNSQLTGSDASEYYNFSLSGGNIKMNFDATTNASSARVVLYDSKGGVVADSGGNVFQKDKYKDLTSGKGLSATSGDYSIKVTYMDNADTTKNLNYNFQLYSGNSYAVVYKNKVKAQAYDNTASGSMTGSSTTALYTTSAYNKIKATAKSAINIGWLQQDKSMLDVYSTLTSVDSKDYYSFTLQQGDNLKFDFKSSETKNESNLRVQLMNSTGTYVIADNKGTAAQRAAYDKLTTKDGLAASAGGYTVSISYADGATKTDSPYEFGIYSGSVYAAEYKTTASAETYAHAILNNEVKGSSSSTGIAAYLTALSNSTDTSTMTSLTDALKAYV